MEVSLRKWNTRSDPEGKEELSRLRGGKLIPAGSWMRRKLKQDMPGEETGVGPDGPGSGFGT